LLLLGQVHGCKPVAFAKVFFKVSIAEAVLVEALNPFHAAGRKIRCRYAAFDFLQHFKTHRRCFKGDTICAAVEPANGKHLAFWSAHFPNLRPAPLLNMSGAGEGFAKGVELGGGHEVAISSESQLRSQQSC
jgi:hypothetical protein